MCGRCSSLIPRPVSATRTAKRPFSGTSETDARLERDAALLRAKLELLNDVLNQLRHRERLDFDRRDLRVELRQLEQLFDELPQPLAMFARDFDEPPLLLRR